MLQIATGNHIGQGGPYMLGGYDSLYVAKGAVVASTEDIGASNWAIVALGSDQSIVVDGTVIADGPAIKIQHTNSTDGNESVEIGTEGTVYSKDNFAIDMETNAGWVHNNGLIHGSKGISIKSFVSADPSEMPASEIINRGTIDVINNAVVYTGPEALEFTNTGMITSSTHSAAYYGLLATGSATIRNSGTMEGFVMFGGSADTYDGRGGTIDGTVYGFGGNDRLIGGAGKEDFYGGQGRDLLTGGGGADDFIYYTTGDSGMKKADRDLISDFSHKQHDHIDLAGIDAIEGGTNDAFHFLGTHAFDGKAGALRYDFKNGHTFVYGDTDGDRHADFGIELGHHVALVKGDFML